MQKIIDNIKKKPISLDQYINDCLYKYKSSYYEKDLIFGPRGDFITSPYISSIFGEIIAIFIINYFLKKKIFSFKILEIGAGEGLLAEDIIKTISKFKNIKCQYYIIEKSKKLKKIQKNKLSKLKVKWFKSLEDVKIKNCFIVSNELLDAFAVKHFKKINDVWNEKFVKYDFKKKNLITKYFKITKKNHKIFNFVDKECNFIEFSPDIFKFVTGISKVLMNSKNNFFLTIDYGYNSERYRNSLQGLMKHKKVDIFSNQGFVDITYLVNFNLIKSIFQKNKVSNVNISTQSDFLKKNGIIERFNQSKKLLDSDEKISKLHLAVNRLINDKKMGSLFKVMTASNND